MNRITIPIRLDANLVDNNKSVGVHSSKHYEQILIEAIQKQHQLEKYNGFVEYIAELDYQTIKTLDRNQLIEIRTQLIELKEYLTNRYLKTPKGNTEVLDFYLDENDKYYDYPTKILAQILNI